MKILKKIIILIISIFCIYLGYSESNNYLIENEGQSNKPKTKIIQNKNKELTICSFNIQFLGNFKKRDDEALCEIIKEYDIVVIQELVAPPSKGIYPDGTSYNSDPESLEFFECMESNGFKYELSEEDTGTGEEIHKYSSATEWWVAFYKPEKVTIPNDIKGGFLAKDHSDHQDYERVPYAFPFRTIDNMLDFVLISVHLQPGSGKDDKLRRKHELSSIANWVSNNNKNENDFIILGDMNIENKKELLNTTPKGFISLNDECRYTNTNLNNRKPYDHIMYMPSFSSEELDLNFDMQVIDLLELMKKKWTSSDPYPGDPYVHNNFRQIYSDHHPIIFKMKIPENDDD